MPDQRTNAVDVTVTIADIRAQACRGRGLVEPRRAVDPVAIEERHGRIAEIGSALDDRFRERSALQKAEGGGGVELDVR